MSPEEIVHEFRRRYENTYVYVQEPNSTERNLFHIDKIEAAADKQALIRLSSDEIGKINLNFGSAHELIFVPAPVGVFQHNGAAYLCRRNPIKQYRKGIHGDNTQIIRTTNAVLNERNANLSFDMVANAFKRETSSYTQALKKLTTGKYQSVALGNNFSICLPLGTEAHYILFFWDVPVARIDSSGTVVKVYEKVFSNAISQATST